LADIDDFLWATVHKPLNVYAYYHKLFDFTKTYVFHWLAPAGHSAFDVFVGIHFDNQFKTL